MLTSRDEYYMTGTAKRRPYHQLMLQVQLLIDAQVKILLNSRCSTSASWWGYHCIQIPKYVCTQVLPYFKSFEWSLCQKNIYEWNLYSFYWPLRVSSSSLLRTIIFAVYSHHRISYTIYWMNIITLRKDGKFCGSCLEMLFDQSLR